MTANRPSMLAAVVLVAAALIGPSIMAQTGSPAATGKSVDQLWGDFLHYIRVARPDLAKSFGEALLDSGAQPKDVYLLSVKTVGASADLIRGEKLPGLAKIILRLRKMIELGHEALRKDPTEIARSIKTLGGTIRGFEIAARRLAESGEYATPQLIQALRDPTTPVALRERITDVLPRLGKQAVRPLSVALQAKDPELLEIIASALGRIEYPSAAARLKELTERKGILPRTRRVAATALVACAGQDATAKTTAAIYYDQALSYYYQKASFAPDIRYATANVWYWAEGAGLTYRVVPRAIFCDIYAMRMCRLALAHDPKFYPAVSLWLAANIKRQADLPDGATDPTYGTDTPSAEYFALASGAKYLQAVLARGLKDLNSDVARGAIFALAQTAGAKNLVQPVAGGAQPLVEALSYPDRHVRFLAAVSLANALPEKRFTGCQLVMPQLTQAIRQTGKKRAVVVIQDESLRNKIKDAIRAAGYEVIDNPNPAGAIADAHKAVGVDVVVLAASPDPVAIIASVRQDPLLATLPVIVAAKTTALRSLVEQDKRIVQIDSAAGAVAVADALHQADVLAAGAAMTPADAAAWSVRAAQAVEYLGTTGNNVFDVNIATGALIAATGDSRQQVRLAAAKALSVIGQADAQRAVAALAVDDGNDENVRVAAFGDLSASLRRYGNQLSDALAQQVLDVVQDRGASPELLNAAAQTLGAMNLPSDKIKSLILTTAN